MSSFCVYVCAPFEDGTIAGMVHDRLVDLGITPTSSWIAGAGALEDFSRYSISQLRELAAQNDADLRNADAVLVMARDQGGAEMFAEARMAIEWNKAVVWAGRLSLSAWRTGVVRVDSLEAAFVTLAAMKTSHAEGARGQLLAHLARSAA